MARRSARAEAAHEVTLTPLKERCEQCGQFFWVAHHSHRTVAMLSGLWRLTWVVRHCLSQEILLARPLLSSTQGDLTALLKEVKAQLDHLEVAVRGVISDGEETIGSAVAFVFPGVPHQLCQFHSLKDATKLLYEADRHAKTQLKKQLRGVRPIERALEEYSTPENEAIRGYCLAVRASLTDGGRSPLQPSGLKLYDRITQVSDSIARVQEKKGCHPL